MPPEPSASNEQTPEIAAFLYPHSPWASDAAPHTKLFREVDAAEIAAGLADAAARRAMPPGAQARSADGLVSGTMGAQLSPLAAAVRYAYPEVPGYRPGFGAVPAAESQAAPISGETAEGPGSAAGKNEEREHFEQLLVAECGKAEERGRREGWDAGLAAGREAGLVEGRREGQEETKRELEAGIEDERSRLGAQAAGLLRSFAEARESYVHRLEQESARLALAIAARVLRREVDSDPLLLTGAVRVALGQLAASTAVRLHVPVEDGALWTQALELMPGLAIRPEVLGDPAMAPGDCRMETELGTAELSLDAQLATIERSFFDRSDLTVGANFSASKGDVAPVGDAEKPSGAAPGAGSGRGDR